MKASAGRSRTFKLNFANDDRSQRRSKISLIKQPSGGSTIVAKPRTSATAANVVDLAINRLLAGCRSDGVVWSVGPSGLVMWRQARKSMMVGAMLRYVRFSTLFRVDGT
jgi:hypothetical protein